MIILNIHYYFIINIFKKIKTNFGISSVDKQKLKNIIKSLTKLKSAWGYLL